MTRDPIKEIKWMRLGDLIHNPRNWKTHPQRQKDALVGAVDELGFGDVVKAYESERAGGVVLLDGHGRKEAMPDLQVRVAIMDYDDAEADLYLATFDSTGHLAETDSEMWSDLMSDTQAASDVLQGVLDEMGERFGVEEEDAVNDIEDVEPQIDKATELQDVWQTELGQVWELGEHRLVCGDCTDSSVIAMVLNGKKADMMFTDPPYGVGYTGGHFHSGDVNIKRERPRLANDRNTNIYSEFLPVVLPFVDGPCYVWFASSVGKPVYDAIIDNGCQIHAMLIWNKTNATYAAMNAQYKQRHEPCMYFKPKGSTLRWVGPTNECTVWDEKRDGVSKYHPTQKPVVLPERAIKNHSAQIVLDVFAGSGSTIIACERLNRKCRAIEIEPKYVAVTLQRYLDATGKTPILLST